MADDPSLFQDADTYMLAMIQRVQDLGSRITDFTGGSGARTLYESLGAGLSQQSAVAEQLRQDSYLATATGDALDRKAGDFRVVRKAAIPAAGTITLTRDIGGIAVTIAAGWGNLLTPPTPGQQPVAFITTGDAVFGTSDLSITVAAQAVEGGSDGNVPANTKLLPQNPVPGFDTDGGFKTAIAFTGGVDVETDDALRDRVPIEVAGRAKGSTDAFLAAALRVPGAQSASVLFATDTRDAPGSGTLDAGQCEVYYEGDASLQTQVESEVDAARVGGQNVSVFRATAIRIIVDLQVFCLAGVDHPTLAAAVTAALVASINAIGVDQVVHASEVVKAVHDVPDVISANVPFNDLRKNTDTDNHFGDITCGNVAYPSLAAADVTVTVTDLS